MDFDEGKRWLKRARTIDLLIWEKEQEIKAYEDCLEGAGINYDKINIKNTPENKFEKIMCEIAECFDEIKKLNLRKMEILSEINDELDKLGECPERYVLRAFYVKGQKMSEIAEKINYDEGYCYELRKKGIERL